MNTEQLYRKLRYKVPAESTVREFVLELVKNNDVPDSCSACLFRDPWNPSRLSGCDFYEESGFMTQPRCTITDFIKYLLENI